MIGMTVSFRYEENFDIDKLRAIAQGAKRKFIGLPGLHSKTFTLDADRKEAVNYYVWESEAAARAFLDEEQLARVTEVYGVRPTVNFVEVAALVENR